MVHEMKVGFMAALEQLSCMQDGATCGTGATTSWEELNTTSKQHQLVELAKSVDNLRVIKLFDGQFHLSESFVYILFLVVKSDHNPNHMLENQNCQGHTCTHNLTFCLLLYVILKGIPSLHFKVLTRFCN